ncbi:hypothetical protein [Limobrevibacterium gyesilva]|uniref:Secreted protein n=1 Tax=Limobrevibacterium gyesilva TaxID=2991712 RepID=A0AA41YR00_9PROT|nr:hypothetical protein [Limobrevibacterium gyesilva]MCW3477255.1 hypothetical protein [Limobrevibacterium gyesilva]
MPRLCVPTVLMALLLACGTAAAAPPAPATPPVGQNSSFNLVNRSNAAIRELFVTAAGNANWGQNRLDGKTAGATSIAPGASFAVRRRIDTNCVFDLRVVFADGRSEEKRGVNTCAVEDVVIGGGAAAANPATGKAADDPSFKLFNRAARPITEIYAAPAGLANWGQNRLDKTPLPPDTARLIALPRDGNCIYDLRVVFADNRAMEKKRTNLCRVPELAIP